MSYDIRLANLGDESPVEVPNHTEGGTYAVGGTTVAELNVTYNYGWFFRQCLDTEKGLRWLYGKTGAEVTERLERAVAQLGTNRYADYWASTPGNAGHALDILLGWARLHPSAVFRGD